MPNNEPNSEEEKAACVYHDGACTICNREIEALKAIDSGLIFVDVHKHSPLPYDKEQMLMHLHAVTPNGKVLTGLDANLYMLRECHKHWLAKVMAFPLIYVLAKPLYNLWAKRRYNKLYGR